jgi:serine protease Do
MKTRTVPLILALLWLIAPAQAQFTRSLDRESGRINQSLRSAFKDVVKSAARSTVIVQCDGKDVSMGTIVDADGWIITKASELTDAVTVRLRDGRVLKATLAGEAEDYDLAMLKIDAKGLTPAKLAMEDDVTVGQWVATVGTGSLPMAVGIVSVGKRRIPSRSGMLGVGLLELPGVVKVIQVLPESGAARAGILKDDLILAIGGKPIQSRDDVTGVIQDHRLGDQIKVMLKRGDKEMEVIATLGKRAATTQPSRSEIMNAMGGPLSKRAVGFPQVFQHDTVLAPNECGGPVVNLDGQVVGINIARAGRTESYALPADLVIPLIEELKQGKAIRAPTTRPSSLTSPAGPRRPLRP